MQTSAHPSHQDSAVALLLLQSLSPTVPLRPSSPSLNVPLPSLLRPLLRGPQAKQTWRIRNKERATVFQTTLRNVGGQRETYILPLPPPLRQSTPPPSPLLLQPQLLRRTPSHLLSTSLFQLPTLLPPLTPTPPLARPASQNTCQNSLAL